MKNLIIILLALSSFAFSTQAQNVGYGVTAGANFATLTGDIENTSFRIGGNVGLFTEYATTKQISIQPEILFSMQGEGAKDSKNDDIRFNLNYINIPVKFKYATSELLDIYVGPQFGFLSSAKEKVEDETTDIKDVISSTDFGGILGLDYVSTQGFGAGLGYNFGFFNINKSPNKNDFSIRNSVLNLNLIYKLSE